MQIHTATLIGKDFQQSCQAAGTRMRQHDDAVAYRGYCSGSSLHGFVLCVGTREDAVDSVDELDEMWRLAVAWLGHIHGKIGVNVGGVAAQHDDAIGEDDGFFDVVRNDENRACGNFVAEPKLQ